MAEPTIQEATLQRAIDYVSELRQKMSSGDLGHDDADNARYRLRNMLNLKEIKDLPFANLGTTDEELNEIERCAHEAAIGKYLRWPFDQVPNPPVCALTRDIHKRLALIGKQLSDFGFTQVTFDAQVRRQLRAEVKWLLEEKFTRGFATERSREYLQHLLGHLNMTAEQFGWSEEKLAKAIAVGEERERNKERL